MSLNLLDTLLWAAGFLLNAALLCVLLWRRRYRTLPWFTAWIAYGTVFTILLYALNRLGLHQAYKAVYWGGAFLDMLFQVAVVLEIGGLVLRRNGRWVESARRRLLWMGLGGTLLAFILVLAIKPPATHGLALWTTRGTLFTAILVCSLFTAVVATSQEFGLGWQSHAIRVGYGLTVWALIGFIVDTLHGFFGPVQYAKSLDYVEMFAYIGSLLYWLISLAPVEVARPSLPDPERNRVAALQTELQFRARQGQGRG